MACGGSSERGHDADDRRRVKSGSSSWCGRPAHGWPKVDRSPDSNWLGRGADSLEYPGRSRVGSTRVHPRTPGIYGGVAGEGRRSLGLAVGLLSVLLVGCGTGVAPVTTVTTPRVRAVRTARSEPSRPSRAARRRDHGRGRRNRWPSCGSAVPGPVCPAFRPCCGGTVLIGLRVAVYTEGANDGHPPQRCHQRPAWPAPPHRRRQPIPRPRQQPPARPPQDRPTTLPGPRVGSPGATGRGAG
jgi:hypothetical protein